MSPLELLNDTIRIEPDAAVQLAWAPPGQAGISTVRVTLDISHHGGTKGKIECTAEDTGSLELPASLVTQLLDLGVAGFPSIVATRESVGPRRSRPAGSILSSRRRFERPVEVAGLTSCNDSSQCPDGQTCQSDLTCQ